MSEIEKSTEGTATEEVISRNFIEQIIDKDLAEGKCETIKTRFRQNQMAICILGTLRVFC